MKYNTDSRNQPILADTDKQVGFYNFPYRTLLSFAKLIEFWQSRLDSINKAEALIAKEINEQLSEVPELLEPIEADGLLKEHKDFIELLMSGLFAFAQQNKQLAQAIRPFSLKGVYQTPKLKDFLQNNRLNIVNNKDSLQIRNDAIVRAGCMILNRFYGQKFPLRDPYIFSARAEDTLLETHYKGELNLEFLDIVQKAELPELSQKEIYELVNNPNQPGLWLHKLPPTHFEFQGVITLQFVDVTEDESLSRIRRFLLQKDAVLEEYTMSQMEDLLASYFDIPDLRLGLTDFYYPNSTAIGRKETILQHLLNKRYRTLKGLSFSNSIYEEVCKSKRAGIFQRLSSRKHSSPLELALVDEGIESIYIAPLQKPNGQIFGLLELGSPKPLAVNSFLRFKINEIRRLFQSALSRKIKEIDNEIGAIIRKKYTNIHPSVEWRFLVEANRLLRLGGDTEPKPIVFEHLYPLYAQADIVGSTIHRNKAVHLDKIASLEVWLDILKTIESHYQNEELYTYLDIVKRSLSYHRSLDTPDPSLDSVNSIAEDLYLYFEAMQNIHPEIGVKYNSLKSSLKSGYNLISINRKRFEVSVNLINKTIAAFLDEEEEKLQNILPHYFERQKTDGIAYDIYIGQSLLEKEGFDLSYLDKFRFLQLKAICELTQILSDLEDELPHRLSSAQLIMVYNEEVSLRFRMDEKKFDVDGDVRYALLKKRVDKAVIKGTNDRLTLAGKLVIVYSLNRERKIYDAYIQEIIASGVEIKKIEYLDLAPLQGVLGLRAIRLTI